jgi:hypothetical protein
VTATEIVKDRALIIVARGFDRYGYFNTEEERRRFFSVAVDLIITVSDRIEARDQFTISPIKEKLLAAVFIFSFDKLVIGTLLKAVAEEIYAEIRRSDAVDKETIKSYERYELLLSEAVEDFTQIVNQDIIEHLSSLAEYGEADRVINLGRSASRLLVKNRPAFDNSVSYRTLLPARFNTTLRDKVDAQYRNISSAAQDINEIISDSDIKVLQPEETDLDLLTATFAGEGKKVYNAITEIISISTDVVGFQGSFAGSIEYKTLYFEYLMAMSYGKTLPLGVLGGDFGKFEDIFQSKSKSGEIKGLKFLETLYFSRSTNQSEVALNPVGEKFLLGIRDRFGEIASRGVSYGSLMIEAVYIECLRLGDAIQSVLNRPPGGIGDTTYLLSILQSVFPPSLSIKSRLSGMTGGIYSLLASYRRLFSLAGEEPDLGVFFEKISQLSSSVQVLSSVLKSAGFKPRGIVASLALKIHNPSRSNAAKRLRELGFTDYESDQILSADSFSALLERFSPMTDSQDVISFFRAFELTKLIYEFGGQESIDQYVNFLYGVDESKSLLRLLEMLDKNRSMASKVIGSSYSRLIGYLITLTYAINPEKLLVLNRILAKNNLNLFESITFLVQSGQDTILRSKEQIALLSGVAAQMIISDNSLYEFSKGEWNDLISKSAGRAGDLTGLYDITEGIIPEELREILNRPSATSPAGQLIDGVRGGNLTSLLRYCNLIGILFSLSDYRNSGQLINRKAEEFSSVLEMVSGMDRLTERMDLTYELVKTNTVERYSRGEGPYLDPLVTVQNKTFESFVDLVSGTYGGSGEIAESPGIGNSRTPNGIRMTNSLTPEEAAVVVPAAARLGLFASGGAATGSGYVRFSVDNLLASGLFTPGVSQAPSAVASVPAGPLTPLQRTAYTPSTKVASAPSLFDPVRSCERFGGTNCASLGYDSDLACRKNYNKALFPEQGYGESLVPGSDNPTAMVDRPLGQALAEEKTPLEVPDDSAEYYFTQFGLSKSSRSKLLKDSEMLCASLDDPFEYSACISLLKCKKFKPPYVGKYSLPFCPTTLQGGRFIR